MPRSAILPSAGKRGMNMNFDHEELTLMMLYNTGTRMEAILLLTGRNKQQAWERAV